MVTLFLLFWGIEFQVFTIYINPFFDHGLIPLCIFKNELT